MIKVKDLWKSYGNTSILKGLDLEVPAGKTLIILGRSGVGKSVLLRQITGLERPDRGEIIIDDIDVTLQPQQEIYKLAKNYGMLFQSSALFDSLSVGENVAFYLKEHARPGQLSVSELKALVHNALKKVGLEDMEQKMPSELSGGQKRRAALARLIIYRPKIMLYDEPTTGLDPVTAMQINHLIAKTHDELKATTIIVTHDIQSALTLGDLFALHHEGKIATVESKESFIQSKNPIIQEFLANAMIDPKYATVIQRSTQNA